MWKAHDTRDGAIRAIKKIDKSFTAQSAKFLRMLSTEAAVMNTIDHPNVMKLYDYLETDFSYYLVVKFCKDGDLEKLLSKTPNNRVDEPTAVNYLSQILLGFQQLRKHKVIHRDIKLANLFVDGSTIVIGDFGFAKSGTEVTGTKLGTPATMAPEILSNFNNQTQYNSKADIWSLGVVFYQLLFGAPPFPGDTQQQILAKIKQLQTSSL